MIEQNADNLKLVRMLHKITREMSRLYFLTKNKD